jgi:hypothetical protein
MSILLPIGMFLVFAAILGVQKGHSQGRRFAWPFRTTWQPGIVQNLFLAAWLFLLAMLILAGADRDGAAGACALVAAAFLLAAGVRTLTDPEALQPRRNERDQRSFAYGLTAMGVFVAAFGVLLLA